MKSVEERLYAEVLKQPYPFLFATVSGAHLYGFPSPDSDFDLRGAHVLPVEDAIGLDTGQETIQFSTKRSGFELDLVSHDIRKFFLLLLKRNGYVLEQLYSPLIVFSCEHHDELKTIARSCITKNHSRHYLGFAETQWRLFQKEKPARLKPLLYVYRVLLTGIHLMRTGAVESNLATLNEQFKLPYVNDLIARKLEGNEKQLLVDTTISFHEREFTRLKALLEESAEKSKLPDSASAKRALDDLLKRLRLGLITIKQEPNYTHYPPPR